MKDHNEELRLLKYRFHQINKGGLDWQCSLNAVLHNRNGQNSCDNCPCIAIDLAYCLQRTYNRGVK